jgi:hypothetical protein
MIRRRLAIALLLFSFVRHLYLPCVVGFFPVHKKTLIATLTLPQSSSTIPPTTLLLYGAHRNEPPQKERPQTKEEEEDDWGNHWIRPSAATNDDDVLDLLLEPSESEGNDDDTLLLMDVSVDGALLQTGPLSQRIDAALQRRWPDPIRRRALVAQMTAQQVLSVVLQHSGLELANATQVGGTVEAMHVPEQSVTSFDSWEALAEHWLPGETLSFRWRQVPTRRRSVSWETWRASFPEATDTDDDDPPITTLAELKADHTRRVERAPRSVATSSPYTGTAARGYRVLSAGDIRAAQQRQAAGMNEDPLVQNVTRHVMHALVAHGCLLVEWTDPAEVAIFARMWEQVATLLDPSQIAQLPPLQKVADGDANTTHIKVGLASYQDGQMQFLERRRRSDGTWLPALTETDSALAAAFDVQAALGRALVQLVVAASTEDGGGPGDPDRAVQLARDWVDDGTARPQNNHTSISMSPHRLCRYQDRGGGNATNTELFGAHTDSSFLTVVPVAAVAGLEVYDEAAAQWYRPEAAAWQHHSRHHPHASPPPWYARYAVFMAGEWLQLASGNQVAAVVHRVVAANRTSAPVLLRARPDETFDVLRYLGVDPTNDPAVWPVWKECQGKRLSEIHDALQ